MYERLSRAIIQARSFLHARKFSGYRPQAITWEIVGNWLTPYNLSDRKLLYKLIRHVRYFTDEETQKALVRANEKVLGQLSASNLGLDKIIYVQVHDAGSSSGVMLNLLRDSAKLEKSGCRFIDGNSRNLAEITRGLGEGAIIYVDDFAGSGKQFTRVHRQISPFIVGRFVEFFLAPCVAEEAVVAIGEEGVEVVAAEIHFRKDRPLLVDCAIFKDEDRDRLLELTQVMYSKPGLGFKKLATMVVFARQCPNSVPLLLRGSQHQKPYVGLLPRTTDMPSPYSPVTTDQSKEIGILLPAIASEAIPNLDDTPT